MVLGLLEGPDLIIVLVVVMVMFGAKKLPELARGLGQAKREFEDATSDKKPTQAQSTLPVDDKPAADDTVTLSRAEYEKLRQPNRVLPHIPTSE